MTNEEKKLTKKEAALEYLQEKAVDIRRQFPTLVDAQYSKGKVVLTVRGEPIEAPEIVYKGVKLDVAIRVTDDEPEPVTELSEAAQKAKEIRERKGVVPLEGLHIPSAENAIGPDGNSQRRDQQAYENWKKRFGK